MLENVPNLKNLTIKTIDTIKQVKLGDKFYNNLLNLDQINL